MTKKTLIISDLVVEFYLSTKWVEEGVRKGTLSATPMRIEAGLPPDLYAQLHQIIFDYMQEQDEAIVRFETKGKHTNE